MLAIVHIYVFLIGVELNFLNENYTVYKSDMSVQLSLKLSKVINCCSVTVLLKCGDLNDTSNGTSKLFSFVLIFLTTFLY